MLQATKARGFCFFPICDYQRYPLQIGMPEVTAPAKPSTHASSWTRQNPFPGKLVVNRTLSTPESEKDTRHFEIDLTGWGLSFEPGDSLAVYPTNDPNWSIEIICTRWARKAMKL